MEYFNELVKLIEPYNTVLGFVLGIITALSLVWGWLKKKSVSLAADNDILSKTIVSWKTKYATLEKERNTLSTQLDNLEPFLPEKVLEAADRELADGNDERAIRVMLSWLIEESEAMAQLFIRLAESQLALVNDSDNAPLMDAERFARLALLTTPNDKTANQLLAEITAMLAVSHDGKMSYTESSEMWDKAFGYIGDYEQLNLYAQAKKYQSTGHYHMACVLFQRIVTICRRNYPANHPDTLTSQNNLASALNYLGRHGEAEELLRQTWEAQKVHSDLGPDHPKTLVSKDNLASAAGLSGRHGEAEELLRQTWEAQKVHPALGPNHPKTQASQNNLASALNHLGRHGEAEELLRQMWEAQKVHPALGPDHPSTLTSQFNLASTLSELGRHGEAEELLRQTWEAQKVHSDLGPDHPSTLVNKDNLASVLYRLGRYDEAEELNRQTWEAQKAHPALGPNHPHTLASKDNLVSVLGRLGRYAEADEIAKEIQ